MLSLSNLCKLNTALSNLGHAIDANDQGAITLFAAAVWQHCVDINPNVSMLGVYPPQYVFVGDVRLHAFLKLNSAVAAYVSATHLNHVTGVHLKAVKHYIEVVCDLNKVDSETVFTYRPLTGADEVADAPLAPARTTRTRKKTT